jgi:hypothetical protein
MGIGAHSLYLTAYLVVVNWNLTNRLSGRYALVISLGQSQFYIRIFAKTT